jgi:hypothetical protein
MDVTEVGTELGETLFDVDARPIPIEQSAHRKSVSKIVQAGAMAIGGPAQSDLGADLF